MSDVQEQKGKAEALRTTFARGIVVIVPIVITVWVLNGLFSTVDGIISPVFDRILERHIPGLGFVSMLALIMIIGVASRNLVGHTLFRWMEKFISSIPVARTVYGSMKDVVNALQIGGKGRSFRQVVLIEYPRQGLYTIGFVTNEMRVSTARGMIDMASVYVPNPPNPTSGLMVLVPKSDLRVLEMSVESGLKLVLSGGMISNPELVAREG